MNMMNMTTETDLANHHDVLPELQHLRIALHHLIQLVYWQTFKWQKSLLSKSNYGRTKIRVDLSLIDGSKMSNLGQCQSHN